MTNFSSNFIVIGSGFSGIAAATNLASKGYEVTLLEKHEVPGGRARSFSNKGFTFDMGPSWYWMPDVFDRYFESFGKKTKDYYQLKRLDPSYQVVFDEGDSWQIPADKNELSRFFDSIEKGSGANLDKFLKEAAYKYKVGMQKLVFKPGRSFTEFLSVKLIYDILRMDIFRSFAKHIRSYFQNKRILQLMEFPILLLGALPKNTPALYSLMNYADIQLGTWYPMGGMHKIIEGMVELAEEKGVKFVYNCNVQGFNFQDKAINEVITSKGNYPANVVVASADYHFVESRLIPEKYRSYSKKYWDKRHMAPSSLIFYLGIGKKLNNLEHHNLFFDADFAPHAKDIYENISWPEKPLFYLSVTSKTDPSVAPEGCENLFVLIPVAPGLDDNPNTRQHYLEQIIQRLEKYTGQSIREDIIYQRSYAHNDFIKDYNAFKGNAYGLANTLNQTAIFKPKLKSKKIKNLYFTGQLTVPGPGVPPSIISGTVVAREIANEY